MTTRQQTTNEQRSERAYRALLNYSGRDTADIEASAVDLMTDLLHMMEDYGTPEDAHAWAWRHYLAERDES